MAKCPDVKVTTFADIVNMSPEIKFTVKGDTETFQSLRDWNLGSSNVHGI
jgi:hypothetical protein